MIANVQVFLRGFIIVALTAANVSQIAGHHWIGAFFNGGAISWVWWRNSHTAAHSKVTYGQLLYALGAGCGTVVGMFVVDWMYHAR